MIGVFDSGIGGLTVLKEIKRRLPGYDLVYFGDTARVPYGNKSPELIRQYALEDAKFLLAHGARLIVAACNTASAVALDFLRQEMTVPVFGVIEPAARAALAATQQGRIGVIGTRATVNSNIFKRVIQSLELETGEPRRSAVDLQQPAFMRKRKKQRSPSPVKVFSQAAPLLVPLIEENYGDRPETIRILKHYLQPLQNQQIDTLILGCTHYPIIQEVIEQKLKGVKIINSAAWLAADLKEYLDQHSELARQLTKRRQERYFVSDLPVHLQHVAKNFMGRQINLELSAATLG